MRKLILLILFISFTFGINSEKEIDKLQKLLMEKASNNDVKGVISILKKLSDIGDAKSQYFLGVEYIKGIDIKKDVKKGLELIQQSANQGYAKAEYFLGFEYLGEKSNGYLKKDCNKGLKYLYRAVDKKFEYKSPEALNAIGLVYLNGWCNVKKNYFKAYVTFSEAGLLYKNKKAMCNIALLNLTDWENADIKEAKEIAIKYNCKDVLKLINNDF